MSTLYFNTFHNSQFNLEQKNTFFVSICYFLANLDTFKCCLFASAHLNEKPFSIYFCISICCASFEKFRHFTFAFKYEIFFQCTFLVYLFQIRLKKFLLYIKLIKIRIHINEGTLYRCRRQKQKHWPTALIGISSGFYN